MEQHFSSVAVVGATGNVGTCILTALCEARPAFKSITILTRSANNGREYPSNVVVREVNYSSQESLVSALTGVEAVISAVATQSIETQNAILDAAVSAKVKFFVPSEFGLASNNPRLNRDFPTWADKVQLQDRLATLKREGKIDYTLVFTGLFLDWGMDGFVVDVKNKSIELWDDGERPMSMTTMPNIGKVVVALLQGKARGKTEVRVKDINISQKRLLELATEVTGKEGWKVTRLDTKAAATEAAKKLKEGTASLDDMHTMVKRAVVGGEYGFPWSSEEDDSEVLGLKPWTEKDVVDLIRKAVS